MKKKLKSILDIPEYELFLPLDGIESMLELGNKKTRQNDKGVLYKKVFERLGIRHVSVDWNGRDGALNMDLREPLNLGRFDLVSNCGTTEHVDKQEPVWRNIAEAAANILVCSTPMPGDWHWHGEFYPKKDFYYQFAERNGFVIEIMRIRREKPHRLIETRMRRVRELPFTMPDEATIYVNTVRPR